MRNAAIFFFLAAASTGLFGFLIATHWIETRAAERRVRDRLALLKKIADQPAESGRLVIDLLREEDAREEQRARLKRQKAIRDDLQGGALIVAAGVGVSIMLAAIAPPGIWTVGLVPALVGVVIFTFAYFSKSLDDAAADGRSDG
jgi:hypothetical protein